MTLKRDIRYQAAILDGDNLLMLKVWAHNFDGQTFWVMPGGGRIPGETEEECVLREVREETNLEVVIERLLFEVKDLDDPIYQGLKTYLCRVVEGSPLPGLEPEFDTDDRRSILAAAWFDLRDPRSWDPLALNDPITVWQMGNVMSALGYDAAGLRPGPLPQNGTCEDG